MPSRVLRRSYWGGTCRLVGRTSSTSADSLGALDPYAGSGLSRAERQKIGTSADATPHRVLIER